jgi:hypothetical protein
MLFWVRHLLLKNGKKSQTQLLTYLELKLLKLPVSNVHSQFSDLGTQIYFHDFKPILDFPKW